MREGSDARRGVSTGVPESRNLTVPLWDISTVATIPRTLGLTTLNTRHPLLEFLEAADVRLALRSGSGRGFVERMERRELRGSGSWVGGYHAYFVTPSTSGVDKFHCVPHADVAWAVGSLVYGLFRRQLVPVDESHLSDCLFGVQDVLLKQEMKSWFVA